MILDEIIEAIGIEPYYREPSGVIYCGDCLEILPKIKNCIFDIIIADPPYNVTLGTKSQNFSKRQVGYKSYYDNMDGATYIKWVNKWFAYLRDISHTVFITPGNSNQFIYGPPIWTMAWIKPNGATRTPLTRGIKMMHSCWEPILVYGKPKNPLKSDVINCPISFQSEANGHPCPKPLKLFKKLILMGEGNNNDIILDPFLGSGTTAVAAKQLGKKYIGIEIEEDYCEISKQRLAQEQLPLGITEEGA